MRNFTPQVKTGPRAKSDILTRLKFTFAFSAVLTAVLLGSSPRAEACVCQQNPTIDQAYEKASVVFVGQAISVKRSVLRKNQFEVRFSVTRKFKGFEEIQGDSVLIFTSTEFEYCGYNFHEGMDYLVIAGGNPAKLTVNSCDKTNVLENAKADVDRLIKLSASQNKK